MVRQDAATPGSDGKIGKQHEKEARPEYCEYSKQYVIDRQIILDGSFNWYNTSVVSHDMLIVLNHYDIAKLYLQEADQILSTFRTLWLTDAR